ncbi:MAG: hypothetical protein JNM84_09690 [Planctomycetes bacterium]|nr:hypothetical protein [Planctomycetota bacterium]
MESDADDLKELLERLEARARKDAELAREFEDSAQRFHGGRDRAQSADAPAEQRHREYFLLERVSARLGTTPILALVQDFATDETDGDGAGEDHAELVDTLCGSLASLFEVLPGIDEETNGVRVEDLASGRALVLTNANFRGQTRAGDLLVGRVFPWRGDAAFLSPGAARIHDAEIVAAVKRDLAQARSERLRAARLSQLELEELFFRPRTQPVRALEHVEAELLGFLEGIGSDLAVAEELRELALGAEKVGAFLGPLLEDLAFDTSGDLDVARRLGLEYWHAQHALRAAPRKAAPRKAEARRETQAEATARASAIEAFERGRAEGKNLDELFQELESALGLDGGDEEDAETEAPWDVVGIQPILEEYLWDRERVGEPLDAEETRQVREMAEAWDSGSRRPDSVDSLDAAMIRDYALIELPRWIRRQAFREPAEESAALRRGWRNFERFCAWLDAEHSTDLGSTVLALEERCRIDAERCLALTHGSPLAENQGAKELWVRALSEVTSSGMEIEPLMPSAAQRESGLGKLRVAVRGSCRARPGDLLRVEFEKAKDGTKDGTMISVLVREVLPEGAEEALCYRRLSPGS